MKEIGGYDENMMAEDYHLWARLVNISKIFQIRKSLVKWRQFPRSKSANEESDLDTAAHEIGQQIIRSFAGKEVSVSTIKILSDSRTIRLVKDKSVKRFMNEFVEIIQIIIEKTPSFYHKTALKKYLNIEISKYNYILSALGYKMSWNRWRIKSREDFLGFIFSRRRCPALYTKSRLVSRLINNTISDKLIRDCHF